MSISSAPGLAEAHPHGPRRASCIWQLNADVPSLIGPMDEGELWYFMPTGLPAGRDLHRRRTRRTASASSTGIDLPYRILSSDEWVASRLLADSTAVAASSSPATPAICIRPFGGFG